MSASGQVNAFQLSLACEGDIAKYVALCSLFTDRPGFRGHAPGGSGWRAALAKAAHFCPAELRCVLERSRNEYVWFACWPAQTAEWLAAQPLQVGQAAL